MKQIYIFLVLALLTLNIASAATIKGTIYSFDLEEKNNSIVTINTNPTQTLVSKDGSYEFNLGLGTYQINASYYQNGQLVESTSESIKISKEGTFALDLILFPTFEEEDEFLQ